jgi:two-component system sensor histidine kinase YesM
LYDIQESNGNYAFAVQDEKYHVIAFCLLFEADRGLKVYKLDKIKNIFKNKTISISYKTLLVAVCTVLIVLSSLAVSFQSYFSTKNFILDQMRSINTSNLYQIRQKLDNNLMKIENVAKSISQDTIFLEDLYKYKTNTPGEMANLMTNIKSFLGKLHSFNKYIEGICIFTEKPVLYFGNFEKMSRLLEIKLTDLNITSLGGENAENSEGAGIFLYEPGEMENAEGHGALDILNRKYFFYNEIYKDRQQIAKVIVTIDPVIFAGLLGDNENLILINKDGKIIYTANEEIHAGNKMDEINENILENNNSTSFIYTTSAYNYFKIIYYQDAREIDKDFLKIRLFLVMIVLATSLLTAYFARRISEGINKSVKSLLKTIERYDFGSSNKKQLWTEERKKITLRERIFFYLSAMVIIPMIIITFILYFFSVRTIKDYIVKNNYNAFVQTAENIQYFFQSKVDIVRNIIYDYTLQEILTDEEEYENFMSTGQGAKILIDDKLIQGNGRDEIFVYNKAKNIIVSNLPHTASGTEYFRSIEQLNESGYTYYWTNTQKDLYNRYIINLFVKIKDLENLDTIGYLQSQISEHYLENIYRSLLQGEDDIFIVDNYNAIISHFDKNRIGEKFEIASINKEDLFELRISGTPWRLMRYNTYESYKNEVKEMLMEKLYLLIVLTSSIIIASFMLSFVLTGKLNKLADIFNNINIEQIDLFFPEKTFIYEINKLGMAFNDMVIRIEALIDQLLISAKKQSILESKKKEAELAALQAQINPHFLYNTFESINWLIKANDRENAVKMLNDLSDLLRYLAKTKETLVTIEEEIMHAKLYSNIMKMRFKENLSFTWKIPGEVMNCKIIKFTLQPLIENAIYHGIMPKQNKGTIQMECRTEKDKILVVVSDDGVGIDRDKLEKIEEELDRQDLNIGLYNVQNRIKILFGNDYGMHVKSIPGEKTEILIRIPRIT